MSLTLGVLLAAVLGAEGFQPWGDAPFEQAGREQKPVLLLVSEGGDAGGLEQPEIVARLSSRFVAVSADPIERPDIADIYRTASSMLPETPQLPSGPVVFLLTPERRPFGAARRSVSFVDFAHP